MENMNKREERIIKIMTVGEKNEFHLLLSEVVDNGVSRFEIVLGEMVDEDFFRPRVLDIIPLDLNNIEQSLIEAFSSYIDRYVEL